MCVGFYVANTNLVPGIDTVSLCSESRV